ncbi:beta lactamase [Streptomyces sp. e14]|uniref:MBL fold metallo-hydrolase n=1 Tax=unclassified Streptomyces TaxID=2593676 RepID=UPI0001D06BBD|nr:MULTISPECIES: MBL fold metallo-hydrolase [unclassified Streptomyces]EFF89100.1 beta lactamase [Streptomyces sp. e14]MYS44112.1 MBL fold metallo-hydrolase [Streptomyces sp. SID5998]NED33246.1 MBL fold metallo-hydrolase [Streptomyces sp. SID8499]NED73384.1 MBL fold metallo-hydrolase [Streptomyces sp. SID9944]
MDAAPRDDRHAWEAAGLFEEAPGVYRIPLPLPGDHLKAMNVYAVPDGERLVLIDAGLAFPESEQLLAKAIRELGYELGDVTDFLVTHVHRDHYTQAVAIRRTTGARIALGEGERVALDILRGPVDTSPDIPGLAEAGADDLVRHLADWRGDGSLPYEEPDRWLDDGALLPLATRRLRVIATPGHTRGHVVFHDPDAKILFAGDHVLPHITPSIGVEVPRARPPQSPLRAYLRSLRLVRSMPDTTLLPAHGPAGASTHARVDELLDHHEHRLAECAAVLARGASTGYQAAGLLKWTRRQRALSELDLGNQVLAVQETVAHLEILVERGQARRERQGHVLHYELSPEGAGHA